MLILKTTHEAAMAAKDAEIAGLAKEIYLLRNELDNARDHYKDAAATIVEEQNHADKLRHDAAVVGKALKEMLDERDAARAALIDVANMETPHCANIGRRMAGRARQALPGGGPAVRLVAVAGVA